MTQQIPMTVEQAVEYANRITVLGTQMPDFLNRGTRDELYDHALHAYTALRLVYAKLLEAEQVIGPMLDDLDAKTALLARIAADPRMALLDAVPEHDPDQPSLFDQDSDHQE